MPPSAVPEGSYRIRQAGAKSDISNEVWNGKKCFYVQIGIELSGFESMEKAQEFVAGKDLVPDPMSLDFDLKPEPVEEPAADEEPAAEEEVAPEESA